LIQLEFNLYSNSTAISSTSGIRESTVEPDVSQSLIGKRIARSQITCGRVFVELAAVIINGGFTVYKVGLCSASKHGTMFKDMSTYYISDRWKSYGTQEFEKMERPKDTRGLGFISEKWEERSKKKRSTHEKIGNNNVTRTSNKNVTIL
jgi:hypothetical protein